MSELPKMTFKDRMSFKMTEARAARWSLCRQKGRKRFILKTGILYWGVPMFVMTIFFINSRSDQELTVLSIGGAAFAWILGGALYGWLSWTQTEKQYQEFNQTNSTKEG